MRFAGPLVLVVVASILPAIAQETPTTEPVPQNRVSATLAVGRWNEASRLELAPLDYTLQQSGRFSSDGLGITVSYHRRLARSRTPAVFLGGDLGGNSHDNERAAIWTNVITGEQSKVRLSLVWGYVTGSSRLAWREGRKPEVVVGVGAGLYLLKMGEEIEDFGYADAGTSDRSWGGYLSAGLRFPIGSRRLRIATDFKWHAFSFKDLGPSFPGQEATGPAYTIEAGADWSF